MNTQKGFTLVEGLLIFLVVAVVCFGGYYIWSQNQDNEVEQTETTQQEEAEQQNNQDEDDSIEKVSTIPEGWIEYENSELGISFIYPTKYGDVEPTQVDNNENQNFFEFSKDSKIFTIGGFEKDYTTPGRGGSLLNYGGYLVQNGEFFSRDWDGSKGFQLTGYRENSSGNCVFSLSVDDWGDNAYHATCNLSVSKQSGFNFRASPVYEDGSYVGGQNKPPIDEDEFIAIIESVSID